jgi:hypothetical protein
MGQWGRPAGEGSRACLGPDPGGLRLDCCAWIPAFAQGCPGKILSVDLSAVARELLQRDSPCAGLTRASTSLHAGASRLQKTWVPTDQSLPQWNFLGPSAHGLDPWGRPGSVG